MTLILSIIAFIVIFSLLILIHESGHFFAARKCGIKVEEFGLGMPPRLWSFKPKKGETVYSLNAIPFGGFVRLYGEDMQDKKILQAKNSFAAQSVWKKIVVIVAGVAMNFILALVLLIFGFIIGMQPLFLSAEDVFQGINSGVVNIDEGLVVKTPGENNIGFKTDDKILTVNGTKILSGDEILDLKDQEQVSFTVERSGQVVTLKGVNNLKKPFYTLYDPMYVPRVFVKEVAAGSNLFKAGVQPGDMIKKVNGSGIFSLNDFEKYLSSANAKYDVEKGLSGLEAVPVKNHLPVIVISGVSADSPAAKIGIKTGDEILAINGITISKAADLVKALADRKPETKIAYKVSRDGVEVEYYVKSDSAGLVGVMLSELHRADNNQTSYYLKTVPYSLKKVSDVSYPWYQAPGKAMDEIGRLTVLTAGMFVNVFSSVFTKFMVPEGVAGPVGIAQMTYVFVQEGFMSLVRFTALLSLSLAIINILPFPGLDGGRLFLIVIPLILRKKLNPRLEAMIHLFGFLVLMVLILLITFNDLAKIFSGL
jgi:regulator of sigma E protease